MNVIVPSLLPCGDPDVYRDSLILFLEREIEILKAKVRYLKDEKKKMKKKKRRN